MFHSGLAHSVSHSEGASCMRCRDGTELHGRMVLDATGHARKLIEFDEKFDPGYQARACLACGKPGSNNTDSWHHTHATLTCQQGCLCLHAPCECDSYKERKMAAVRAISGGLIQKGLGDEVAARAKSHKVVSLPYIYASESLGLAAGCHRQGAGKGARAIRLGFACQVLRTRHSFACCIAQATWGTLMLATKLECPLQECHGASTGRLWHHCRGRLTPF